MDLGLFFKSIIDLDKNSVVICNLEHEIIYMNEAAAENYEKYGGYGLIGQNLMNCHNVISQKKIKKTLEYFLKNKEENRIYTGHNNKQNKDVYIVAIRDEGKNLIGYYEKHEYRNSETSKPYDFV